MHAQTIRVRPLVSPAATDVPTELDNPLATRLLQIGIAAAMGLTLLIFHQAVLTAVTSVFVSA